MYPDNHSTKLRKMHFAYSELLVNFISFMAASVEVQSLSFNRITLTGWENDPEVNSCT